MRKILSSTSKTFSLFLRVYRTYILSFWVKFENHPLPLSKYFFLYLYKQQPPFGAKIRQVICPLTVIISYDMRTAFLERSLKKTKKDKVQGKYTSIISRQMEIIVFIILQMFLQRAGKMLTNSLLFAARHVYFSVFFGSTLETNKHVSSITVDTRSSWFKFQFGRL